MGQALEIVARMHVSMAQVMQIVARMHAGMAQVLQIVAMLKVGRFPLDAVGITSFCVLKGI